MKFKKIVIIGTGLIGGSIGRTLIKKKLAKEVVGVCRRTSTLKRALREKAFTSGYVNSYGRALRGVDIVFICTPVDTIKKVISDIAPHLKGTRALVTDVGSTKTGISDIADRYRSYFSFVGGHPLAGSEKTGVEYASEHLFENTMCILTPSGPSAREKVIVLEKLWRAMGARVEVMSPAKHDKLLSFTSHLPHVAAYALAGSQRKENYPYMAGGFRDTTRIASSDPLLWSEILIANRKFVLAALSRFRKILSDIENDIRKKKKAPLHGRLRKCKEMRDGAFGTDRRRRY